MREIGKRESDSAYYTTLAESRNDEAIANMLIVLLRQEDMLLNRFIESEGKRFAAAGGIREKLTHVRLATRKEG